MTTVERPEPQVKPNGTEPKPGPTSRTLLDQVRSELKQREGEQTVDIRLPIRKPAGLVARYGVVDPDEMPDEGDVLAVNVAVLAGACRGLYVKTEDGLEPLVEDGQLVTYSTAAQAFGIEADSVKATLLDLFEGNEIALDHHATQVFTWMRNTSLEVEGQVMGESSA